jgi:hypothetical protein
MIKGINGGYGVQVSGGFMNWPSFYNTPSATGNTLIGQLRYNGSSQNLEVYDGNTWLMVGSSYPTVELSGEVQSIVNWARMKMAEEARIRELADKHPAVAEALRAVEQAQEQVKIVAALVDNA